MAAEASFDYYAELGVERTASEQEITGAYRRLALVHHPDKNPGNVEEATVIFQKIQEAHETLSDPAKRQEYDRAHHTPYYFQFQQDEGEEDEYGQSFYDWRQFSNQAYYGYQPMSPSHDHFWGARPPFASPFNQPTETGTGYNERQEDHPVVRDAEEEWRQRSKRMRHEAALRAALREQEEKDKASKKEAERQCQEESLKAIRESQLNAERKRQETRWQRFRATTKEEKAMHCLHSEACTKIQHKNKVKCDVCKAKRGMTSFQCPHCDLSLCQLCVTRFTEDRVKEQKREEEAKRHSADKKVADNPTPPTQDREEPQPSNGQAKEGPGGQHWHKKRTSKKEKRCYNCGESGHFARDCPYNAYGEKKQGGDEPKPKPKPKPEQKGKGKGRGKGKARAE
ncbi:hypothetical protein F4809DRAFT_655748 [Biscogniauxia mediterranea]|nr:hypothetical protein F4809DRAFT_655748 [Biscogniauxia mediterranea]